MSLKDVYSRLLVYLEHPEKHAKLKSLCMNLEKDFSIFLKVKVQCVTQSTDNLQGLDSQDKAKLEQQNIRSELKESVCVACGTLLTTTGNRSQQQTED